MAALVRNGFLNKYNTNFNMFPCVDTYRLTNLPTMLGGRAKEIKHQILYLSRQRPKGQKLQQPNQSKDSVQNAKLQPAQVKRLTKQRGITLCPQPRENALKVALIIQIQKALWLETRTQHLLLK